MLERKKLRHLKTILCLTLAIVMALPPPFLFAASSNTNHLRMAQIQDSRSNPIRTGLEESLRGALEENTGENRAEHPDVSLNPVSFYIEAFGESISAAKSSLGAPTSVSWAGFLRNELPSVEWQFEHLIRPIQNNLPAFLRFLKSSDAVTSDLLAEARSEIAKEVGLPSDQIFFIRPNDYLVWGLFYGLNDFEGPSGELRPHLGTRGFHVAVPDASGQPVRLLFIRNDLNDFNGLATLAHEVAHSRQDVNALDLYHRNELGRSIIEGLQQDQEYQILLSLAQRETAFGQRVAQVIQDEFRETASTSEQRIPKDLSMQLGSLLWDIDYQQEHLFVRSLRDRMVEAAGEAAAEAALQEVYQRGNLTAVSSALVGSSRYELTSSILDQFRQLQARNERFYQHVGLSLASHFGLGSREYTPRETELLLEFFETLVDLLSKNIAFQKEENDPFSLSEDVIDLAEAYLQGGISREEAPGNIANLFDNFEPDTSESGLEEAEARVQKILQILREGNAKEEGGVLLNLDRLLTPEPHPALVQQAKLVVTEFVQNLSTTDLDMRRVSVRGLQRLMPHAAFRDAMVGTGLVQAAIEHPSYHLMGYPSSDLTGTLSPLIPDERFRNEFSEGVLRLLLLMASSEKSLLRDDAKKLLSAISADPGFYPVLVVQIPTLVDWTIYGDQNNIFLRSDSYELLEAMAKADHRLYWPELLAQVPYILAALPRSPVYASDLLRDILKQMDLAQNPDLQNVLIRGTPLLIKLAYGFAQSSVVRDILLDLSRADNPLFDTALALEVTGRLSKLGDSNLEIRSEASFSLNRMVGKGDFSPVLAAHIPELVSQLSSPEWDARYHAGKILSEMALNPARVFHSALALQIPNLFEPLGHQSDVVAAATNSVVAAFLQGGVAPGVLALHYLVHFPQLAERGEALLRALYLKGFYAAPVYEQAARSVLQSNGSSRWHVESNQGGLVLVESYGRPLDIPADERVPLTDPDGDSIADAKLEIAEENDESSYGGIADQFYRVATLTRDGERQGLLLYQPALTAWESATTQQRQQKGAVFVGMSPYAGQVFFLMPWGELLQIWVNTQELLNDQDRRVREAQAYFKEHQDLSRLMTNLTGNDDDKYFIFQSLIVEMPLEGAFLDEESGLPMSVVAELTSKGVDREEIRPFVNHALAIWLEEVQQEGDLRSLYEMLFHLIYFKILPGEISGYRDVIQVRQGEFNGMQAEQMLNEAIAPDLPPAISAGITKEVAEGGSVGLRRGGVFDVHAKTTWQLLADLETRGRVQTPTAPSLSLGEEGWTLKLLGELQKGTIGIYLNSDAQPLSPDRFGDEFPDGISHLVIKPVPSSGMEEETVTVTQNGPVITTTATALRIEWNNFPRVTISSTITEPKRVLIVTPDGLTKLSLAAVFAGPDGKSPLIIEALAVDDAQKGRVESALRELGLTNIRVHSVKSEFGGNTGEGIATLEMLHWQQNQQTLVVTALTELADIAQFLGVPGAELELFGVEAAAQNSQSVWS